MRVCVRVCVRGCIYVCVYVCMCVYLCTNMKTFTTSNSTCKKVTNAGARDNAAVFNVGDSEVKNCLKRNLVLVEREKKEHLCVQQLVLHSCICCVLCLHFMFCVNVSCFANTNFPNKRERERERELFIEPGSTVVVQKRKEEKIEEIDAPTSDGSCGYSKKTLFRTFTRLTPASTNMALKAVILLTQGNNED